VLVINWNKEKGTIIRASTQTHQKRKNIFLYIMPNLFQISFFTFQTFYSMKKTFVIFGLCHLMFSSCVSTSIISNKADSIKNEKSLSNKRILLLMHGDERSINFYQKMATAFAQEIGKEHKISVNYIILSQISFTTEEDIKKKEQEFKADYVMDFKVGRYERWGSASLDLNLTTIDEQVLNINIKCLESNKDVWKAALTIGSVDYSAFKGYYSAAKRLTKQLENDKMM
jgi:hypothetical protein